MVATPKEVALSTLVIGKLHNFRYIILNNAHLLTNHVKVRIDVAIYDDVLLTILIDDTITIGGAIFTYVAWPIHLAGVYPKICGFTTYG
ncbi:hypothetical protein Lal_00049616 [Lupinus albus]|nr:hypothetical protein Lal_00049616 [Lupinus albus]